MTTSADFLVRLKGPRFVSSIPGVWMAPLSMGTIATFWQVLAVPLVIVANTIPFSPGGLGVGETVGAQLFSEFGLASGGMVVLSVRLGMILVSLPGAVGIFTRSRTPAADVE